MNEEIIREGVLELELTDSQIEELIAKLNLLKEGEDHVHFSVNEHNQILLRAKEVLSKGEEKRMNEEIISIANELITGNDKNLERLKELKKLDA